ncbi:MAG: HAD family phosphatase [Verrucomicrobiota bacterium]
MSTGILFDLDGVLIDSHDQHEQAWFALASERDLPLTKQQFKESFGMRNETCIPDVFGWTQEATEIAELGDRKEELYRQAVRSGGLVPLPGVMDLIADLLANDVPFSLGSSTSRLNIELCLEAIGLTESFGPHLTGAEDVSRGKPNPEVFLTAAKKISHDPEACIVIEDAHVGVEAALAGGMKAVAVTTTHPADSFRDSGASLIVASLEELSAERLRGLLS